MANITIRKNQIPFTQVANCVLTNPTISAAAKGIYCYLCSKPDGWQFHTDFVQRELKESLPRFRAIISELIDAGLILRSRFRDDKTNQLGGTIYEIITPGLDTKKPGVENSTLGETVTYNNTDIISNTERENEKEIKKEIPQRGPSDASVTNAELFDFWNRELLPGRDNIAGIQMFGDARQRKFHALLNFIRKDQQLKDEREAFAFFKEQVTNAYDNSPFLQGKAKGYTDFRMDFDFCLQQSSFTKMVEGKYEN